MLKFIPFTPNISPLGGDLVDLQKALSLSVSSFHCRKLLKGQRGEGETSCSNPYRQWPVCSAMLVHVSPETLPDVFWWEFGFAVFVQHPGKYRFRTGVESTLPCSLHKHGGGVCCKSPMGSVYTCCLPCPLRSQDLSVAASVSHRLCPWERPRR